MNNSEETKLLRNLITAISNKKTITFNYTKKDGTIKKRVVNPHTIYDDKNNNICIDGLQIKGSSDTITKGFKVFKLDNITDLIVLDKVQSFEIESIYNPDSDRYINSIIKVSDYNK